MIFNEIFDFKVIKKRERESFVDDIYNFLSIFTYFTSWNLIFIGLYLSGYLGEYYHTILLLQIFIVICSIYIVYIKRDFRYHTHTKIISVGNNLGLLDLLIHQLPLFILLINNRGERDLKLGLYLLPLYYYLIFDMKRYNIKGMELLWVILIWLLLPFIFNKI